MKGQRLYRRQPNPPDSESAGWGCLTLVLLWLLFLVLSIATEPSAEPWG